MRLIDADALIEFIDAGHLRHPSELCFSELDVVNMLNHAPTAYNVDAVVEKLKEEAYTTTDMVCGGLFEAIRLSSAINIVKKRGGVK